MRKVALHVHYLCLQKQLVGVAVQLGSKGFIYLQQARKTGLVGAGHYQGPTLQNKADVARVTLLEEVVDASRFDSVVVRPPPDKSRIEVLPYMAGQSKQDASFEDAAAQISRSMLMQEVHNLACKQCDPAFESRIRISGLSSMNGVLLVSIEEGVRSMYDHIHAKRQERVGQEVWSRLVLMCKCYVIAD